MAPKRLLSIDECARLVALMREAFVGIDDLRNKDELAAWIQYPKVPSILSESLCVHLIGSPSLASMALSKPRLGGKVADIIALADDNNPRKVEVKATARSAFSEFVEKDIQAHYLIWLHFGECFVDERHRLQAIVLESPSRCFDKRRKITLDAFRKVTTNCSFEVDFSIDELQEASVA